MRRLPRHLYDATCSMTDSASATNTPPMITSHNAVWLKRLMAPTAAPRPSEPTSPKKTEAGWLLNQRKPTHAPARLAHHGTSAWLLGSPLNTQSPRMERTIATHPAAKPSNPSVRLTAWAQPAMTIMANGIHSQPRSIAWG